VRAEITDNKANTVAGWIFFDADCRFCVAGRHRWGQIFERRGFIWLPLQTPGTAERLNATSEQLMAEMWVLPAGAAPLHGVDAWIFLLRHAEWLRPLAALLDLPSFRSLAQIVYRWVARNRYCFAGHCCIPPRKTHSHPRHAAFLELP
jgi:predicted DCC family thiol-disulfide oxidoreductase YuxK